MFHLARPRLLAPLLVAAAFVSAQQAPNVDDALLQEGSRAGEWVSYNYNWSEQRYSSLNQVNDGNVSRLKLAWSYDIPAASSGLPQNRQEATHLVRNGILYSIAPWSIVYAVDARTGKELWHADPDVNQQVWQSRICCGVVNRGIALYGNAVIAPVIDGRLRALDATSGKLLWETRVSPANMAYTITMAPRVIKGGKVIIGVSGGEYGIRGFFDAYDVETGKLAWRFYTVPGDPSKPFEQPELADAAKTWSGEWWKVGGGAPVWNGMAYDPDADLLYVGTGQPATWTSVSRGPGDNLFTNCILAVRGSTGKLVWFYQTTPGDDWDYDSIADIMLADLNVNGKPRKLLMQAPKNGFFYVLDRRTGELLSAEPWVTVTWSSGVNMKTGRPIVNPEARYGSDAVAVSPGPGGGHVWPPQSYNPATGLVYIPSTIGTAYNYAANPDFKPLPIDLGPTGRGNMNMGTSFGARPAANRTAAATPPGVDPGTGGRANGASQTAAAPATPSQPVSTIPAIGPTGRGNVLIAWDPIKNQERWRGLAAGFNQGGTLSTGGNLVFSSVNTRLLAYRADTGEQLLDLEPGLAQMGPPMTFMIDGRQFVAIAGGPPGSQPAAPFSDPTPAAGEQQRRSKLMVFSIDGAK